MNEIAITAAQARELTDRIRVGVEAVWEMVKQAYQSRAWAVLGYDSWDDYCTREFGTSRIKLPREERQEVVSSMREFGMSTRAIGTAIGASEATVRRELASASNDAVEPAEVTGVNGKTYTPKPRPTVTPQSNLISSAELDELNQEEEVRPVFQAPGEPDPEPAPTPLPTPQPRVEIDRELQAQARAKSSAPESGAYVTGENAASRNAKRFDALSLARTIIKDTRQLAGLLSDTGGILGMEEHLQDIMAALEVAMEANNGNGFDTELNNLLK